MEQNLAPIDLPSRLLAVAEDWSRRWSAFQEKEIGVSSAAHKVLRDSLFFERTIGGKQGPSTTTLAKFADFFAKPVNWPPNEDGVCIVPESARVFAHINGITVRTAAPSPDNSSNIIGAGEAPRSGDAAGGLIPAAAASGVPGAAFSPPRDAPGAPSDLAGHGGRVTPGAAA